ncbi:hypothetical protein [Rothia sp. HMSC069D01]|uniref:hypothetical protein n=1 Tax=Rothia sp. HMSC069D01 TaxID=1715189 RepID=UPI0008A1C5AD|nr:hypothetical protein [Rothia sp. HMSC069D01]OFM23920.1 hypothetical protein HMPREF2710_08020 [Rothia sp. HMSC069D01]
MIDPTVVAAAAKAAAARIASKIPEWLKKSSPTKKLLEVIEPQKKKQKDIIQPQKKKQKDTIQPQKNY